jgi:hypothetical protein
MLKMIRIIFMKFLLIVVDLDSLPKEIKLSDVQIILKKWKEYLRTSQEVEYSW